MIRTLQLTDIVRLTLFDGVGGQDHVATRERLGLPGAPQFQLLSLMKVGLSSRRDKCIWVSADRRHVWGLVGARMRSGPRAWEVEHLLLSPRGDDVVVELLERLTAHAGQRGAIRIFVRLQERSPAFEVVQRAGFFPCVSETLYQLRITSSQTSSRPFFAGLRTRKPQDDHSLFRLYNAETPPKVRSAIGLTFEEWKDAGERHLGHSREFVYERDGSVVGWLRLSDYIRSAQAEARVNLGTPEIVPALVHTSLHAAKRSKPLLWLVPSYQEVVQRELLQIGCVPVAEHHLMVKSVAARVRAPSLVPARA